MGKPLICSYCGDTITKFQKKTMVDGVHEGCALLKAAEKHKKARLHVVSR